MTPLSPLLQQHVENVLANLPESLSRQALNDEAQAVLAFSDFVRDGLVAHPEWLDELRERPPEADEAEQYAAWLEEALQGISDEAQLMRALRLFRRRIMVRIAWAQTLNLVDTPCTAQGEPQPLMILGMGKLGGGELNFSSDIDLIFAWPENGVTRGGRRELDNAQFFTRMGQRLIKALDQPTQDGFVYRVDMRLRPFGDSGPLVLSFAALEDYYQEQGRDWERYAMVKARLMGDDQDRWSQELQQMLRPFI